MINRTIRSFACALVFSTSVLSCSDDVGESPVNTTPSAAPGSGGAGGGSAEPGATQVEDVVEAALGCLGLTASHELSGLSLAEAERACRGARQCEALIRWSTDAELCWILAAVTGNQANADTAQATCEKQYSDCIAAPDVELKEWRARVQALLDSPCGTSEGCEATAGQLALCMADLYIDSANIYPSCENLKGDIEVGKIEQPESCTEVGDACMAMIWGNL